MRLRPWTLISRWFLSSLQWSKTIEQDNGVNSICLHTNTKRVCTVAWPVKQWYHVCSWPTLIFDQVSFNIEYNAQEGQCNSTRIPLSADVNDSWWWEWILMSTLSSFQLTSGKLIISIGNDNMINETKWIVANWFNLPGYDFKQHISPCEIIELNKWCGHFIRWRELAIGVWGGLNISIINYWWSWNDAW